MQSKLVPLGENVIIKPLSLKPESKIFVVPNQEKKAPEYGVVVHQGASSLQPGDEVFFDKYSFDIIKVDDVEYSIGKSENVLAILHKD